MDVDAGRVLGTGRDRGRNEQIVPELTWLKGV